VSKHASVSIVLTSSQLAQVARETTRSGQGVASLLGTFENLSSASRSLDAQAASGHISRSVLRALIVLAAFPCDGAHRALGDVAKQLGFSPSTVHRYASTWLAIGLLEQDPTSRQYRRPAPPTNGTHGSPRRASEAAGGLNGAAEA
jgi:IclR helix-turn-helix domain